MLCPARFQKSKLKKLEIWIFLKNTHVEEAWTSESILNHAPKFWWRKKEDEFFSKKQQISKSHKSRTKRNFDSLQTAICSVRIRNFKKICCHAGSQKVKNVKNAATTFWPTRVIQCNSANAIFFVRLGRRPLSRSIHSLCVWTFSIGFCFWDSYVVSCGFWTL